MEIISSSNSEPEFEKHVDAFKRGRINLTDDLREGCPSMATTEEDISAVRVTIETDPKETQKSDLPADSDKLTHRILLHHNNASPHTARQTTNIFRDVKYRNTGILAHLPYRPVSCYFYLFCKINEKLRGKRFTNTEKAVAAYGKAVETIPKCEWAKCFSQWFD
ncbi:hypothetical protein EVAR_31012_1 [Eumeta japonica]|uniref:Mariner Mos1 transposase n=1 Tax=Eumeta variegata TaxID=151549 RepID=A0A4C1VG79_EUMVA|nr:hypothetical protein EVAR_31012_1 [Eumeta japonica]